MLFLYLLSVICKKLVVPGKSGSVMLSYDGGDIEKIKAMLEVRKRLKVPIIFFINPYGSGCTKNTIQKILTNDSEIGILVEKLGEGRDIDQFNNALELFKNKTGYDPMLFRFSKQFNPTKETIISINKNSNYFYSSRSFGVSKVDKKELSRILNEADSERDSFSVSVTDDTRNIKKTVKTLYDLFNKARFEFVKANAYYHGGFVKPNGGNNAIDDNSEDDSGLENDSVSEDDSESEIKNVEVSQTNNKSDANSKTNESKRKMYKYTDLLQRWKNYKHPFYSRYCDEEGNERIKLIFAMEKSMKDSFSIDLPLTNDLANEVKKLNDEYGFTEIPIKGSNCKNEEPWYKSVAAKIGGAVAGLLFVCLIGYFMISH